MNHTSKTNNRRRLLLDVTIAATTDLNTGIQRVVRNIAQHAESAASELQYDCQPFVCHGNQLSAVGFDGRARLDERLFRWAGRTWMGIHRGFAKLISRVRKNAGDKYLSFLSRLRKLFIPKTLVRKVTNAYRRWTGRTIEFQDNDVLVLLDASWDLPLEDILSKANKNEIPVITVVYDLIPVLHPEFHQEQLKSVFSQWLRLVIENSEMMIGISQTVRDDVKKFWKQNSQNKNRPCVFDSFRLGSDFKSQEHKSLMPTSKLRSKLRDRKDFYLAVGTIEPRKNHKLLLDTFDELWEQGSESTLVIAGKFGWMCDELQQRIQNHPLINDRLIHFEDATDDELAFLYQDAKALLFPSIVEGFGLPIVEAFQFGTPVLAADTRIHREVAGENAIYFGLHSSRELATIITRIESEELKLGHAEFKVVSWAESCSEFFAKIDNFLQAEKKPTAENKPPKSLTSNQRVA